MPLTDTAIRNAKPGAKAVKLFDGGGLYLEVTPAGGKLWRLKYRHGGKEKRLALGAYPVIGLRDARDRRDAAKRQLADGIDPGAARQIEKIRVAQLAADSFEAVLGDFAATHLKAKSETYRTHFLSRMERLVLPYLGSRPVAEISAPEVLAVVRRIEQRGLSDTAHRTLQNIGQVCRFAVATARATADPTASLRGALAPHRETHQPAPADDPAAVGAILRAMDAFKGGAVVGSALRLLPMVFVRPGELRKARWEQIDLDAAEWKFHATKTEVDHLVPLSTQAVAILRDLKLLTGNLRGGWVFPGGRSPMRPMSDMAINAALRRLGVDTRAELTGHGWRAVARTFLHERLGYRPEVIEMQLAHAVPDTLGRAYNRTRFSDERKAMMQAWSNYLDKLKAGAEVIQLPGAA